MELEGELENKGWLVNLDSPKPTRFIHVGKHRYSPCDPAGLEVIITNDRDRNRWFISPMNQDLEPIN